MSEKITREEFIKKADEHGEKRWYLPDMMRDVYEVDRQVDAAIAAGETPEEFIDAIAKDLDLHDFD